MKFLIWLEGRDDEFRELICPLSDAEADILEERDISCRNFHYDVIETQFASLAAFLDYLKTKNSRYFSSIQARIEKLLAETEETK